LRKRMDLITIGGGNQGEDEKGRGETRQAPLGGSSIKERLKVKKASLHLVNLFADLTRFKKSQTGFGTHSDARRSLRETGVLPIRILVYTVHSWGFEGGGIS